MKVLFVSLLSRILWLATWTVTWSSANPTTDGWKKEDDFWVPVWFAGNAFPSAEELTAISLESVEFDNQELDIVAENESEIVDSVDKECVLSGDEPRSNSGIDKSLFDMVLQ